MSWASKWALACLGAVALSACAPVAAGAAFRAGDLTISDVWARPTAGASDITAVYLTVANSGREPDSLVNVSAPAAAAAELHTMDMSGGMMHMRKTDTIAIPAGGSIALSPGGNHIMVIGLTAPLKAGDTLKLTLGFERAGNVDVEARVHN